MSITPGSSVAKDPDASKVYTFDWTLWLIGAALIYSSAWEITGPDSALTKDTETIMAGTKKTSVRLIGGTKGKTYTLRNRIVTNETPTQTDDKSIRVVIRQE
jgi:hypothetical protein